MLLNEIEKHHGRLFGRFSKSLTEAEKQKIWDSIVGRFSFWAGSGRNVLLHCSAISLMPFFRLLCLFNIG